MNKREKTLTIFMVVLVGAGVLQYVVKSVLIAPFSRVEDQIVKVSEKLGDRQHQLNLGPALIRKWRDIESETIPGKAMDVSPVGAQGFLQSRVGLLITKAGLTGHSVTPVAVSPRTAAGKRLFWPVALNLSGRGTLRQIVDFLDMLQDEPYLVKVTGFTLNPEAKSELLSFTGCRIEALVLAKPLLKSATGRARRAPPDTQQAPKTSGAYALIHQKDIFHPAPVRVSRPPAQTRPEATGRLPRRDIGPRRSSGGRAGDLVGISVIGPESGVYVLRNSTGADWYKKGDRIEGRVIAFVHPLGMVVRDTAGRDMVVLVGENIDRVRTLTKTELPELFQAWQEAKGG